MSAPFCCKTAAAQAVKRHRGRIHRLMSRSLSRIPSSFIASHGLEPLCVQQRRRCSEPACKSAQCSKNAPRGCLLPMHWCQSSRASLLYTFLYNCNKCLFSVWISLQFIFSITVQFVEIDHKITQILTNNPNLNLNRGPNDYFPINGCSVNLVMKNKYTKSLYITCTWLNLYEISIFHLYK